MAAPQLTEKQQAVVAFLEWVKYFSPPLYARVLKTAQLGGLFDDIDWGGLIDKTVELGKKYLEIDQQKAILKMQADRAAAGQMPLTTPTAQIIVVQQQPTVAQQQTQTNIDRLVKVLPWLFGALLLMKFI